jgi:hypothetical protein
LQPSINVSTSRWWRRDPGRAGSRWRGLRDRNARRRSWHRRPSRPVPSHERGARRDQKMDGSESERVRWSLVGPENVAQGNRCHAGRDLGAGQERIVRPKPPESFRFWRSQVGLAAAKMVGGIGCIRLGVASIFQRRNSECAVCPEGRNIHNCPGRWTSAAALRRSVS